MVKPLDKKLSRDLWHIKGQAIAIALVIALGVLMLVMMSGLVNTLEETRRAYYERYRLADVFAPLKRAPLSIVQHLETVPGVLNAESRVTGDALIDMNDIDVPIRALAVSLPDFREPDLNAIVLTRGRLPDARHQDEVIVLRAFALAHDLIVGDQLQATMNGVQRVFTIVGIAQSPEFLYTTAPGELVPDDGRFAVLWLSETAMAAAYDMDGAFNEVLLGIDSHTPLSAILDAVDRLLEPYGGTGAYGRHDHLSDRFVSEEIAGQRASSLTVPPVFLGVAAFLLYIVISRIIQTEREEIGLLKAFGYTSWEICQHYLKLILIIAIVGAAVGSLGGIAAGKGMALFYQKFYKFPFLVFQVNMAAFVIGFLVSILSASLGGLIVLRRVFALTPAVAMRPAASPDYSQTGRFASRINRWLDQPSRMVLRRLRRQPYKALMAVIGIALGMALSTGMTSVMASFDYTMETVFSRIDRSDANLVFTHPLGSQAIFELQHIPGVLQVEPFRNVPAQFRHGRHTYRGSIDGLLADPALNRPLDTDLNPIVLPRDGLVLSRSLANILHINVGDLLDVSVREGRRPDLRIPVSGIADSLLGSPAYLHIDALNRYLKEPGRISGAYLTLDQSQSRTVYHRIKNMPGVIGMTLKQDSRAAFERVTNTGAGAMRFIMALIAAVITFGIIYNSARIAFNERERDLDSLRVIGFTKSETSFVLL